MIDPWAKLQDEFEEIHGGINPHALGVKEIVDEASKMLASPVTYFGVDLGTEDKTIEIELTPTTQLVFECCKCGVIHDPETVSFQTLIDTGKAAGWTIKFRDAGYDAYCKDHSP